MFPSDLIKDMVFHPEKSSSHASKQTLTHICIDVLKRGRCYTSGEEA